MDALQHALRDQIAADKAQYPGDPCIAIPATEVLLDKSTSPWRCYITLSAIEKAIAGQKS